MREKLHTEGVRQAIWTITMLLALTILVWTLLQAGTIEYDATKNGGCDVQSHPINGQCYNPITDNYYDAGGRKR